MNLNRQNRKVNLKFKKKNNKKRTTKMKKRKERNWKENVTETMRKSNTSGDVGLFGWP